MRARQLTRLVELRREGRTAAFVTDLESGQQSIVHEHALEGEIGLEPDILEEVRTRLAARRGGIVEERWYVRIVGPAPRLIIVGAVHIAQALAPMAALAGYAPILVDPRGAFASPERFEGIELRQDWPDTALAGLAPDGATAVAVLSHDPKLDDPALTVALASDAFYIGALGSRRTHARRLERLAGQGIAADRLGRIQGPIGLDIGAVEPGEIAIAILAQMIQARRRPQA